MGDNLDKAKKTPSLPQKQRIQYPRQDLEYGINTSLRLPDSKELSQLPHQQLQIAKLLAKFIANINKHCQDSELAGPHQASLSQPQYPDHSKHPKPQKRNQNSQKSDSIDQVNHTTPLKSNENLRGVPTQRKGGSKVQNKIGPARGPKNTYQYSGNRRQTSNASQAKRRHPDMSQCGQRGEGSGAQRGQDGGTSSMSGKGGKGFTSIDFKSCRSRSDLKLFKRQSYHVAIAYHIHLKTNESTSNEGSIDPTLHARELRFQKGVTD